MKLRNLIVVALLSCMATTMVKAQEDDPILPYRVAPQNLLKFNRFLINPTFSTVREENSYVNLLHRNQSVQFQDNDQTYFLSYSGRIGDRSGLGLSLYNQSVGPIFNIGVLANYAYGIKLSDKSNFTFGGNLAYYSSGLNRNSISVPIADDPRLFGVQDSNVLSFQPGFNLSYGQFDFGVFAENLIDYNLKTNTSLTNFAEKTYSAHLQYTYPLESESGIFEGARLMPLARVRMNAQNSAITTEGADLTYGGNLILDLPKLGWLQGGYDTFYGASAGAGFNLNQRLSLGYTMEKGFGTDLNNLGITHEISFAYSFTPNLTEDRVLLEDDSDELVENDEIDLDELASNEEVAKLKKKLAENDEVLAELIHRQDSVEASRQRDLERRFEMVMRMVKNETKGTRPDLEKRAENLFMNKKDEPTLVQNNSNNLTPKTSSQNEIKTRYEDKAELNKIVAETNNATNRDGDLTTEKPDLRTLASETVKDIVENNNEIVTENVAEIKTVEPKKSELNTTLVESANKVIENNDDFVVENTPKVPVLKTTKPEKPNYNTVIDETKTTITADKIKNTASIKTKKFKNLEGVEDGYYIVANVYSAEKYMHQFISALQEDGYNANYVDNVNNGLKYVYINKFSNWQAAADAYQNNLTSGYENELWIMNIDNSYTNEAYASNTNTLHKNASKYKPLNSVSTKTAVRDKVVTSDLSSSTYKLQGIDKGFYIIANVFANPNNANRFVKLLNSYGLNASYFINPENNWRYVYLKKHESWNNALISYYTKINDSYNDEMWIMRVNSDLVA